MNQEFVKKMMELSLKLDKYQLALMKKCEICGPILMGANKNKYPICKRHKEIYDTI